jgi:hypothetical protein
MGIEFNNLIKDAECVRCEGVVPFAFDFIIGTDGCMCPSCCEEMRQEQVFVDAQYRDEEMGVKDKYEREVARVGVPKVTAEILGLQWNNQEPALTKKGDNLDSAKIVSRYVIAPKHGLLCLSGHNGLGKTVSSCWAAWVTRGRFLSRSEWSMIAPWKVEGEDYAIKDLVHCPGVVVFDEIASLTKAGDMNNPIRVISMIATERHDQGRGTILTTRSNKQQFFESYGNDMLDRMLHHKDSGGSGWAECKGRSLRAKGGNRD